LLAAAIGESFGGIMKRRKGKSLTIDWPGTKKIRSAMASQKSVKITINIDADSLSKIKAQSIKTGVPYQRLLNTILRESLTRKHETENRLERLEMELEKVKKKLAA
jgi:uncharacterized protein (DUF4415 family)